jgi:hypothetical protein
MLVAKYSKQEFGRGDPAVFTNLSTLPLYLLSIWFWRQKFEDYVKWNQHFDKIFEKIHDKVKIYKNTSQITFPSVSKCGEIPVSI